MEGDVGGGPVDAGDEKRVADLSADADQAKDGEAAQKPAILEMFFLGPHERDANFAERHDGATRPLIVDRREDG